MAELIVDHLAAKVGTNLLLNDISFTAGAREFIAIIGENGAGKSTLLKSIIGLMPLCSGSASIDGSSIAAMRPIERARLIGWLPQTITTSWPIRVFDAVAMGRFAHGGTPQSLRAQDHAAVSHAIRMCSLEALTGRTTTSLSGGELARVHIARLMASQVPIMLADEPVAALDPGHRLATMELLQGHAAAGGIVISVMHDIGLAARYASRIIGLRRGSVVVDAPPESAVTSATLRDLFDVDASISDDHGWPQPTILQQSAAVGGS